MPIIVYVKMLLTIKALIAIDIADNHLTEKPLHYVRCLDGVVFARMRTELQMEMLAHEPQVQTLPKAYEPRKGPNPRRLWAARLSAFVGKLFGRKEIRLSDQAERYLSAHADREGLHSTEGL